MATELEQDHCLGMLEIMADHEPCAGACDVCELFGPLTPALKARLRMEVGMDVPKDRQPVRITRPMSCEGCGAAMVGERRRKWCSTPCKSRAYDQRKRATA